LCRYKHPFSRVGYRQQLQQYSKVVSLHSTMPCQLSAVQCSSAAASTDTSHGTRHENNTNMIEIESVNLTFKTKTRTETLNTVSRLPVTVSVHLFRCQVSSPTWSSSHLACHQESCIVTSTRIIAAVLVFDHNSIVFHQ